MKRFACILVFSMLLGSCSVEPLLHLRMSMHTRIKVLTNVNVSMMWQVDWQARWQVNWDETVMGPLGYSDPNRMRMHIYTQGPTGELVSHSQHSFEGKATELDVFVGTHNMLFYNLDSEVNLFQSDNALADVYAYTRKISKGLKSAHPVFTLQQKTAGYVTRAETGEEEEEEPVSLAPESLFSLYHKDQVITENPEDYIFEDGRYVIKIEGELTPATYIYLFRVKLINNDGRILSSPGGAALTGMAQGVNLVSMEAVKSTVSVPMDVFVDKSQDMLYARVMTFGNPGCNPYDADSVASMPEKAHDFVMNVSYMNGSYRNIQVDVTDQIRALPLGGVINLELDVNDFPPESNPSKGGGFDAIIDTWEDETAETTVIF